MIRFALRRLLVFPFILLLANFIGFAFAFNFVPIDTYADGNYLLQALLPEYASYLARFLQLDFGTTYNGEPVHIALARLGIASLGLVGIALTLSIVFGISLGRLAVRRDNISVSPWLTVLATAGLASPGFYIAILLITFFLLVTIYGPGMVIPFQGFGWDAHLILPVLALAIQPTVKIAQVTGNSLVEEMRKNYVTAGISMGHSFRAMRNRFAFRNVMTPVLQTVASSTRLMIAELIIIERLFNWPGLGRMLGTILRTSTGFFDTMLMTPPLMAGLLTMLVMFFLLVDFISLFLARLFDPRLRMDVYEDAPGVEE